jgi:hypothetical protein
MKIMLEVKNYKKNKKIKKSCLTVLWSYSQKKMTGQLVKHWSTSPRWMKINKD